MKTTRIIIFFLALASFLGCPKGDPNAKEKNDSLNDVPNPYKVVGTVVAVAAGVVFVVLPRRRREREEVYY